ncbi:MAG: SUMF1/EgtB/PvdO family nonheme iron enzyme [SAR324 cluster bacterium]|nr:SUMF1/EgtB/PvdO family nonheme iron enzyme [SAR324 cluster bacterium]
MRRLPIYLLLDTSDSMRGEAIESVKAGIKTMISSLCQDPYALETACVSVLTYNLQGQILSPLTSLDLIQIPEIHCGTSQDSNLGSGMDLLVQKIGQEVKKSNAEQKGDWKPLVFIMTSGIPSDLKQFRTQIPLLKKLKGLVVGCAAGPDAKPDFLLEVADIVLSLDTVDQATFIQFFKWISTSISTASQSVGLRKGVLLNEQDFVRLPPKILRVDTSHPVAKTTIQLMKQNSPNTASKQEEKIKFISASGQHHENLVWTEPVTGMKFVWIEGGSFQMGDLFGDKGHPEYFIREVTLSSFWLGQYEVTQGEWKKIMGNNPSHFKNGDRFPVECVSWNDCQQFVNQLNQRHEGQFSFSLPSEAQWEYAARERGRKVRFGNGLDIADPGQINFDGSDNYKQSYSRTGSYRQQTTPVGTFPPNAQGLYDMSGNVWEWCQDVYTVNYSQVGTSDPIYMGSGSSRVRRGGSWSYSPRFVRCAYRGFSSPAYTISGLGFRLVARKR